MTKRLVMPFYFGRQYGLWLLVFLFGLSGIVFLFEIAELMRRAAGHHDVGFAIVLEMGLTKLPETIEHILPFVVLFAGLFTFWRLTRSQELIVARSVGVSAWQFMAPALVVTFAFGLLNLFCLNPLGATLNGRYKALEARYLDHMPTLELTGAGLWLRQSDGKNRYLLHADHIAMNPLTLSPAMILIYDSQGKYQGRLDAPQAVLTNGAWDVPNAWQNEDKKQASFLPDWKLPTHLTLNKIQESMAPPDTISFWELPRFIRALRAIGLPETRHALEFQSQLAQPFLLASMVFFAASFALRMNRNGGVARMIVSGGLLGSGFYLLNNLIKALGSNQTLPVVLAAWAIPVIALALSNTVLLHMEEG